MLHHTFVFLKRFARRSTSVLILEAQQVSKIPHKQHFVAYRRVKC